MYKILIENPRKMKRWGSKKVLNELHVIREQVYI